VSGERKVPTVEAVMGVAADMGVPPRVVKTAGPGKERKSQVLVTLVAPMDGVKLVLGSLSGIECLDAELRTGVTWSWRVLHIVVLQFAG
jgi:hypothetical protein